jgi:ribonuclease HI
VNAPLSEVTIYTDGACQPNPGPGGWAALLVFQGRKKEISGGELESTNNRMELTAAIRALQALTRPCRVVLHTDSEYLKRGITEWLPGWQARNWRRKEGKLANADLWQELVEAMRPHQVEWKWVRGHAGHPENERVDLLARQAIPRRTTGSSR